MRIVYTIIFFLGMLLISWLAYSLLQGFDNSVSVWRQIALLIALATLIAAMALFIRHYLRQDSGPSDK